MKTLNVKMLSLLFVSLGMLFACSDDDNGGLYQEPRSLNAMDETAIPVTLDLALRLDEAVESLSCGEGNLFYAHSGESEAPTLGDYSLDLSYCGAPREETLSNIEVTITDANNNKLFLQQKVDTAASDGLPTRGSNNDNALSNNNEVLILEITGGTGVYNNYTGEISSRLPANFSAGVPSVNMTFTGYLMQQ
ncbi:hypothetical protein [Robertkochia sediminum]|uniref:hypothetical protein n=1 Tax=Robertkochia sediminum TaxID=2785326 RepID=UPI0019337EA0|nr:hypothetical protein [Robertkochia sediminum]MBL7472254.1 hypothetical protein [Robertkochia sediminum]